MWKRGRDSHQASSVSCFIICVQHVQVGDPGDVQPCFCGEVFFSQPSRYTNLSSSLLRLPGNQLLEVTWSFCVFVPVLVDVVVTSAVIVASAAAVHKSHNDNDNDHSCSQLSLRRAMTCPGSQSAWALASSLFGEKETRSLRKNSCRYSC